LHNMSYIGNTAQNQSFTPAVDYFNGDGSTTAFTLSRPVASVMQIEAVIENVVQNPSSAYTVSGNTITFTSAPPSGTNNIYVRYTSPITSVAALPKDPEIVGNLRISSTAARITGDFSNATVANRVMFQSSTTNGNTRVIAIPNGSSTGASFAAFNSSGATNASVIQIDISSTEASLQSNIIGTGTYLPITFYTGGSERIRIDTSGNVGIGTSSPIANTNQTRITTNGTSASGLSMMVGGTNTAFCITSSASMFVGSVTSIPIILSTNDTERMRIDSSGNVGIGTSSPSYKLSVWTAGTGTTQASNNIAQFYSNGNGYDASIRFGDNNNSASVIGYLSGAQYFSTGGSERMRIDSSGNVGIGTSSLSSRLHIDGGSNYSATSMNSSSTTGTLCQFTNTTTGTLWNIGLSGSGAAVGPAGAFIIRDSNAGTTRFMIDVSGNLAMGTTTVTSGFKLTLDHPNQGGIVYNYNGTSTQQACRFVNGNGTVGHIDTNGSATSYVTSSDYRLKEEVAPMTGALDKVALLKPVTYKWKVDGSAGEGFIAHELAEVCPQAVVGEKDAVDEEGNPQYQGIDTSFLVATLTAAIQELKAIVDAQAERIAVLEGK
jgi:hypothetical protein